MRKRGEPVFKERNRSKWVITMQNGDISVILFKGIVNTKHLKQEHLRRFIIKHYNLKIMYFFLKKKAKRLK